VRNGALVERRVEIFFVRKAITQHATRVDQALLEHFIGFGSVVRALFGNRT
jgi:hypothetical protein